MRFFANSLLLGQEGIELKDSLNYLNITKPFIKLYYDCLISLLYNNNDSKIDGIIEDFMEKYNNRKIRNYTDAQDFNFNKGYIIYYFQSLSDKTTENTILYSFFKTIKEKLKWQKLRE